MGAAFANSYISPSIKTSFQYNSNVIGNFVVEVTAVDNDRYETQKNNSS
jgi:hypothetical protein